MTILYQNVKTGEAYDITSLITSASWSTKRRGSPATSKIAVINSEVNWDHGGILAVKDGDRGIFYGYTFKISRTESVETSITAYDQTRYLKNKDTYVFTGKRADQITAQIAEDFKIKTGEMANTGYVIPSLIEDNQTLFDIILKGLDLTLINTGKMFYLWDDYGKLRISNVEDSKLDLLIGDGSMATGYTYDTDIDSETYNKIKLVRDNKDSGKRDVYIFQDSNNIKFWGILQNYDKVDENLNDAQIKERGDQMLELYNRPKKSFEILALSDLSVRAGKAVFISISDLNLKQFFIIEEATHDLLKGTMKLKLKVV